MSDQEDYSKFLDDMEFENQLDYLSEEEEEEDEEDEDKALKKKKQRPVPVQYWTIDNTFMLYSDLFKIVCSYLNDKDLVSLIITSKNTMKLVRPLLESRPKRTRILYDVWVYYVTPCDASNGRDYVQVFHDSLTRDREFEERREQGYHMWKCQEVRLTNLEKLEFIKKKEWDRKIEDSKIFAVKRGRFSDENIEILRMIQDTFTFSDGDEKDVAIRNFYIMVDQKSETLLYDRITRDKIENDFIEKYIKRKGTITKEDKMEIDHMAMQIENSIDIKTTQDVYNAPCTESREFIETQKLLMEYYDGLKKCNSNNNDNNYNGKEEVSNYLSRTEFEKRQKNYEEKEREKKEFETAFPFGINWDDDDKKGEKDEKDVKNGKEEDDRPYWKKWLDDL